MLDHLSCFADHPELLIEVKNRRGTDHVNFPDLNMRLFTCSVVAGTLPSATCTCVHRRVLEHVVFVQDVAILFEISKFQFITNELTIRFAACFYQSYFLKG